MVYRDCCQIRKLEHIWEVIVRNPAEGSYSLDEPRLVKLHKEISRKRLKSLCKIELNHLRKLSINLNGL